MEDSKQAELHFAATRACSIANNWAGRAFDEA
jgi:hypothetical protein